MSKPIINDIDVSECEKLGETIDGFTCGLGKRIRFANEIITKHNLCKDNPNCDFKQLKRLEQKNKELKGQLCETKQFLKDVSEENSKFCQQIEAYQLSENEAKEIIVELKHKNKELKKENEQLKKPCLVMPKVNQLAVPIDKYEKLYKALEEISRYCEEQNLKADYTACEILTIIDKVLYEN